MKKTHKDECSEELGLTGTIYNSPDHSVDQLFKLVIYLEYAKK